MMKTDLYNQSGEIIGEVELSDRVFGLPLNVDLLHQAITAQLANRRAVLAHTKDRSEVRGGGKKPWKQKGTGRARHGSIRSPLWKGGGVTFGPTKNRNFSLKINKKMKRLALLMTLSGKFKGRELMVLEGINLDQPKTKKLAEILQKVATKMAEYRWTKQQKDRLLLVLPQKEAKIERAAGNLPFAKVLNARSLNLLDLLSYKFLLITKESLPIIEETYQTNTKKANQG